MLIGNFDVATAALAGLKDVLDGGILVVFAGPVPASADEPLDLNNEHTAVTMLTVGNDGETGLTFAPPTGNVLAKTPGEEWLGTVMFMGAEEEEETLTPTFYRFASPGQDPFGPGDGPRLQGTVGGPSSGADMVRSTTTVTANGSNQFGVTVFNIMLNPIG